MLLPRSILTPLLPELGNFYTKIFVSLQTTGSNVYKMSTANTSRTRDKASGRYKSKHEAGTRSCYLCSTNKTSQWRTSPDGNQVCNRCGIKLRRGTLQASSRSSTQEQRQHHHSHHRLPPISSIVNGNANSANTRARQVCSIRNIINH